MENIDRLILSMHPKYKKKAKKVNGANKDGDISEKEKKQRLFPGLALPDQEWRPPPQAQNDVDNLMSQFEGLAKKSRPRATDLMEHDDEPASKRRKMDISPPRRRSQSPPRGREYDRGYDDSRGRSLNSSRDGRGYGRVELDERPVVYKIYDGKVSSLRDFGAFVQLEGVKGRVEGKFPTRVFGCC